MSEEKSPKGQVETALEQAAAQREKSEAGRRRELLKLTGGLHRIDFYVSESEYSGLCARMGEGTVETLLESFVADLTRSERSIWKQCQLEARNWQAAHMRAERMARAYFDELDGIDAEGGEPC